MRDADVGWRGRARRGALGDAVPGGGMRRALGHAMALRSATSSLLATLLSVFLVMLWGALAVGGALTMVFPEHSLSVTGTTISAR